ncbi:MAG TPA: dTDP-glucose 4,6-dehydratase, partial [Gammaproteobacteria bacterium]|nr:dTDP-glucose 4,6-dehydratase [Gammaproteobacteria bacterium]
VTGGAGFIGANFVHFWLKNHPHDRLLVLDALTYAGNRLNLQDAMHEERLHFVHGDICDQKLVTGLLEDESIDTIVHFAAESHVDRSIDGPDAFVHTNIVGTHVLLKATKSVWLGKQEKKHAVRFHHVSTDEVYGSLGPLDPRFTEQTPYAPSSPYSASKAAADHLVRAYHRTFGLPVTITNCSNNYGPYQFPEKLIPVIILNALAGRSIPVYGDGRNVRDWLYVTDHCRAIEAVIAHGKVGETYNIGGNCERTNIEIVHAICRLLDSKKPQASRVPHESLIRFVQDRPGHDRRYAIDTGRITGELGWRPLESLESGLEKTIDWYLAHLDWCEMVGGRNSAATRHGLGIEGTAEV